MDVSLMPTQILQRELIKPTGAVPSYLAMAELQKRVAMKQQGDASKAQGPTVAQQLVSQPTAYAQGGIVKLAGGGGLLTDWLEGMGGTPRQPSKFPGTPPSGVPNYPSVVGPTVFGQFWDWLHNQNRFKDPGEVDGGPVDPKYREERDNRGPQPVQDTPSFVPRDQEPPADVQVPGKTGVRAGIGAYSAGAAPDLSKFAMPAMGTPEKAARPDFAFVQRGISLPDRTGKMSEGIAALDKRLGEREKGNLSNALMQFGLGALASKSPWTAVGAGEAGLGALKDYRAAQSEQDKARMELTKMYGDIAKLQGEGDRAGLQAATQNYATGMRSADSADNNAAHITSAQYQGAVQGRNTDVNAAVHAYGIGEQAKARMQAAAIAAEARGDRFQQERLFKYMRYIEDAEKRADASVVSDAKATMLMETNPAAFEFMRAQRREAARQEVLMKMPPDIQREFSMNMSRAGGGQPGVVTALPPKAVVAPR